MNTTLEQTINDYLHFCEFQKRLNQKTLKAYRIDLRQFTEILIVKSISEITTVLIESHITSLHQKYKPKTVKRKIASLKAFFQYLEYHEKLSINPFSKIRSTFREPTILPKLIPLSEVSKLISIIYYQRRNAPTHYQRINALRDVAIIELLFATGIRISELCNLHTKDVNLYNGTLLIFGKGSKERFLHIANTDVLNLLNDYVNTFHKVEGGNDYFFINHSGVPISDQVVRRMINKYTSLAQIDMHLTPHMFRHTFATSLLEADVNIRYIQEMLGHSSINVTEIYTHVTTKKQREILAKKHPRNQLNFNG